MASKARQKTSLQKGWVTDVTDGWMESSDQSRVGGLPGAVNDDTAEGEAAKTLTSPSLRITAHIYRVTQHIKGRQEGFSPALVDI